MSDIELAEEISRLRAALAVYANEARWERATPECRAERKFIGDDPHQSGWVTARRALVGERELTKQTGEI